MGQVRQVGLLGGQVDQVGQVGQVALLGAKWAYLGSSGPTWPGGQLRQDLDCFGTYSTHAQPCDNGRVQSATAWTASVHSLHMPKPVDTYSTHAQTCDNIRVQSATCDNVRVQSATEWTASAQTCDNVRVPSATEWTASVHTLHMPKPVITFVFKVLRHGLLRYILFTCPNL